MKMAWIAVSEHGRLRIQQAIHTWKPMHTCDCYVLEKYAQPGDRTFTSLQQLVAMLFPMVDALIFVTACGIAVRAIAPHVVSKASDPAVLVMDEQGTFVISLLSGHLGGANAIAQTMAASISAIPVITTATDLAGKFSPDRFAKANHLHVCELSVAKEIAARILQDLPIGFQSHYPCEHVPADIFQEDCDTGILIAEDTMLRPFPHTLHLVPKNIVLGIGCKKNTPHELLERVLLNQLQCHQIPVWRVCAVHTIDVKRQEPALVQFCSKYKIPMHCYTAEELRRVPGTFPHSDFVQQTVGVGNVCERSALAAGGSLCLPKQAVQGITVAAAQYAVHIDFERNWL